MADGDSTFLELDVPAFEFHSIKVISLPENRKFNTIKMFSGSRELIYLRPEAFSIPEEDHLLLLRGPKEAAIGVAASIIIGDTDWFWHACFDDLTNSAFGIRTVVVRDPQFPEAAVEITFERIEIPAQAHFRVIFKDIRNEDREIRITSGEIFAISHEEDARTKRLLRCFGDDLKKHMRTSSEIPELKKPRRDPPKLESGVSFGLYKSHMLVPAESDVVIGFDLVLEIDTGGSKEFIPFKGRASSIAPEKPNVLAKKDFHTLAMDKTKEATILKIDDFAEIQVEFSWFNDLFAALNDTLSGYNDGDCDYEDYVWADRQEFVWENMEEQGSDLETI